MFYIHGGDFATVGRGGDLKRMKADIETTYELKMQVLGQDNDDLQQARVLNRTRTWTKGGTSYEADPRHAEIVIDELGLKDAKGVATPGAKREGTTKDNHEDKLDEHHAGNHKSN